MRALRVAMVLVVPACLTAQRPPAVAPSVAVTLEKLGVYVGSEDRGPGLFGNIVSVTDDGSHNVYVADGSDQSIRVFSSTGQFLTKAGQRGQGPGDFAYLGTIWHDGVSRLYALDPYYGVSIFDAHGSRLRFVSRFKAAGQTSGICGMNGELYLTGYWNDHYVHVTDPNGVEKRAFGSRFRTDTLESVQSVYDRAGLLVACDDEARRLYVAELGNDLVKAYSADGKEIWQSTLPDYGGARVIGGARGNYTVLFSKRTTRSVVPVGQYLLVQAQSTSSRRTSRTTTQTTLGDVRTYILSAATGVLVATDESVPLVRFMRAGSYIAEEAEPYPRVFTTQLKASTRKP